jgi:hypothetical protein
VDPITDAECDDIARTPDLVLRNLRITEMYHRLSVQLATLLGRDDANWCTFACHASRTAGYSIRGEVLPAAIRASFAAVLLGRFVDRVTRRVSHEISAGNLAVFAELAPLFARFVRTFHADPRHDRERFGAVVAALTPGATEAGGQDALIAALGHYHDAMSEPAAKRRAELILLGNVTVGLHEQIRLQPHIVRALDAPASLVGVRSFGRRVLTRRLMQLRLPQRSFRLGEDVPLLRGRRQFPELLVRLEHPALAGLVMQWDRDVHSLRGSAARDWGELAARMNYIVDLFRSRQRSPEVFDPPFVLAQRAAIWQGRVPGGEL